MNRGFWFVAGTSVGVYAMVKVRRAAEVFTPEGLHDRMAGLSLGARLFAEEVRAGMAEKETELRERLEWTLDGPQGIRRELESGGSEPLDPTSGADRSVQPTQEYR
jgi:Family of unknown function (DUF6167)